MNKYRKIYVEKKYPSINGNDFIIEEVNELNSIFIKYDGEIEGFRFFEKDIIIKDNKKYIGPIIKYSPWIYFGKRYSIDGLIKDFPKNLKFLDRLKLTRLIINSRCKYICLTNTGTIVEMNNDDITYEEYLTNNQIKLIRKK